MILRNDLRKISKARLKDSEVLYQNKRYDGSVYLCGYAIEIALKARICRTLKWTEFPLSRKDFENLSSLKTHNLDTLLRLSGIEDKIRSKYFAEWSFVAAWEPEVRYKAIGTATPREASDMLEAARILLRVL